MHQTLQEERKSLIEKKSFYKLIKAKYDLKEKEKINKKEKEKKLKMENSRKSDQSLVDLYHKIKEEAFHIHKKSFVQRNKPYRYSSQEIRADHYQNRKKTHQTNLSSEESLLLLLPHHNQAISAVDTNLLVDQAEDLHNIHAIENIPTISTHTESP